MRRSQLFDNLSMICFGWVRVMARFDRLPIRGFFLSLLVVNNLQANEWQEINRNFDLAIYIRHRPESAIEEVRGVGEFNAPVLILKGILADVGKYSEFIPYTKVSRLDQLNFTIVLILVRNRNTSRRVWEELNVRGDVPGGKYRILR